VRLVRRWVAVLRHLLSLVFVTIALAGCAKAPDPKTLSAETASGQYVVAASAAPAGSATAVDATRPAASPSAVLAAAGASSDGDVGDYRIAPLDVLDIAVFQVPDLGGTFPVSVNGQIDMPLIGGVAATGKTLDQLKADITKLLDQYLQSPKVTVAMKDAISQRITVEGAVNKPGVYPTSGPTTLMQVMAMAGGLDRIADERGVVVFRKIDGKRHAAKFDYTAIRAGTADDPVIAGGDMIVVDESGFKASLRNLRESIGLFGFFAPLVPLL
jgi:polysaccharide export outer membrane protein